VIGLGRVGLPLALSFADRGLHVLGVDHDPDLMASIRAGRMPFNEAGTQTLLERVQAGGRLELTERAADAARADDIVITIGTPSFSHVESDLRQVRAAVDDLLPLLRPGHSLVLRSTIAPGTTEFVAGYIEKRRDLRVGEDVFVAHAPERIAAGRFLEEITSLPCIIGGVGDTSTERAAGLFEVFGAPIVRTTPVQAEPADDGLRELRRQRVRGDRADQPGLPAGWDRTAGNDRRHLLAQGFRLLGGALACARDAARRVEGQ
jgi:UDP-N-acetyl-D-mannosaminuronic acid dehydrogenase